MGAAARGGGAGRCRAVLGGQHRPVGRGSTVIRVMREDPLAGAATCLKGPLRRAGALFLASGGGRVSDLSRLGRIYQGEAARLLERYPNARAYKQLHSLDDMVVKDLARTYPTAAGRELERP